jgi:hypothetical protein
VEEYLLRLRGIPLAVLEIGLSAETMEVEAPIIARLRGCVFSDVGKCSERNGDFEGPKTVGV